MRVTVLVENTACDPKYHSEHGLSLWIETGNQRILFDTGESDRFAQNAQTLGIDLKTADVAILSHGHYDHGGGIKTLLELNPDITVLVNRHAFDKHLLKENANVPVDIGLDPALSEDPRIRPIDGKFDLGDGSFLFTVPPHPDDGRNTMIFMEKDGVIRPDDFRHEQNLWLSAEGKNVLVAGCAHAGILNIIREGMRISGKTPDTVISGFHLFQAVDHGKMIRTEVEDLASKLKELGPTYLSGHCTGATALIWMAEILQEKLGLLTTGKTYTI